MLGVGRQRGLVVVRLVARGWDKVPGGVRVGRKLGFVRGIVLQHRSSNSDKHAPFDDVAKMNATSVIKHAVAIYHHDVGELALSVSQWD